MSAFQILSGSIRSMIRRSPLTFLRVAILSSLSAVSPLFAQSHTMSNDSANVPARLIQIVQESTQKYLNVNHARSAGYAPFLGCVTGPDQGAMGIHYVNGALLNGDLNADQPQALIYEPQGNLLKLV